MASEHSSGNRKNSLEKFFLGRLGVVYLLVTTTLSVSVFINKLSIILLQGLKTNNSQIEAFKDYEPAVERASWVRKGSARVLFGCSGSRWENCSLELEQTGTHHGEVEFGTLSVFGTKDRKKEHLSLSEITCVCRSGEKTLTIHTPARSFLLMPLQLKFTGDLEMEEWQADITAGKFKLFAHFHRLLLIRDQGLTSLQLCFY